MARQLRRTELGSNSCFNQGRGGGSGSLDRFDFGAAQRTASKVQTNKCRQQTGRAASQKASPLRSLAGQESVYWRADNGHGYAGGDQVGTGEFDNELCSLVLSHFRGVGQASAAAQPFASCPMLNFCEISHFVPARRSQRREAAQTFIRR